MPTDTPQPGAIVRNHWSIESMHWGLDHNLQQDNIKRKSTRAARNPRHHTENRLLGVLNMERTSQKQSDKNKGMAELIRHISMSFTQLMRFLSQNEKNKILTKR